MNTALLVWSASSHCVCVNSPMKIKHQDMTNLWWVHITPSHYHHCANLSEDVELINAFQIYFVECVSKIKHLLSVTHYTICGAGCFQFTHFPCDDWEKKYILCLIIIIKSEVWTIIHCLGLGHETMVCAVCLSIFIQTINSFYIIISKFPWLTCNGETSPFLKTKAFDLVTSIYCNN